MPECINECPKCRKAWPKCRKYKNVDENGKIQSIPNCRNYQNVGKNVQNLENRDVQNTKMQEN